VTAGPDEAGTPSPAATDTDVVIVGAGPVGLTLANSLGLHGVRAIVLEARDVLIDYPRGVGLDDESLRGFQGIGVVDRVLQHTNPNQIMRFVNGKGRILAEIAPSGQPFGWPRRNGFIQPLVDAELLQSLSRFADVEVRWSHSVEAIQQGPDRVETTAAGPGGEQVTLSSRYVVGCDGGRSTTRQLTGVGFRGTSSPTRWLVIDLRTDPLGTPNVYVGADPARPYVSVSLAHGVRRFEFMMFDDEPEELADDPTFLAALLSRHLSRPGDVDVMRKRVYTHHSLIADSFRHGRVFLAGDAAHLMPVWQGQGYNSGIRDAVNLGWKLSAVVNGQAEDRLLDTYDQERRNHAKAMIDLSTVVGRFVSPTRKSVAVLRDLVARMASVVPSIKQYVVEMRFKPMPRYETGAVTYLHSGGANSQVGRQFIQPRVDTRTKQGVLLDDVLGPWFSVVCWNNSPAVVLGEEMSRWLALGSRMVSLRPQWQLHSTEQDHPDVEVVGDPNGELKRWFDDQEASVLFLRPDRFIAGACVAQHAPDVSRGLTGALCLTIGDPHAISPVLHVTQPSARHHRTAPRA
jgi:3-(3-hydroxy-phenyl)propionate hydroxylase